LKYIFKIPKSQILTRTHISSIKKDFLRESIKKDLSLTSNIYDSR